MHYKFLLVAMSLVVSSSGTEAIDRSYPENQDIESGLNYFLNNSDKFSAETLKYVEIYNETVTVLDRSPLDGFSINNITVKTYADTVTITNDTSRHFTEIAVTNGRDGFLIDIELMPFTSLTFESEISSYTLYFMGPNSQFRSSISLFDSGLNSDDLDSYYLILRHLKQFYAKQSTENDFFIFQ